jgi:hypothetical protein
LHWYLSQRSSAFHTPSATVFDGGYRRGQIAK